MTASEYGYITVANLEAYHIQDYETMDARYTDVVVEAKITHAEKVVRELTNTTTADDGTVSLVLELSKYLMAMQIHEDNPKTDVPSPDIKIFDFLLAKLLPSASYSPAGIVHMSGPDR